MLSRLFVPRWLIRRQAQRWLVRLRGDPPPVVRSQFQAWLAADPRNCEAFELERERFDGEYGLLRTSELAAGRSLGRAARREPQRRYALAASIAFLILVPAGMLLLGQASWFAASAQAMTLTTRVGEIRSVALTDGSTVTLDTQSAVKVEVGPGGRRARLERGRARFAIRPSSHPFVLSAGVLDVRSQAAVVDLETEDPVERIELRSGTAQLVSPTYSASLSSGEGVIASAERAPAPYRVKGGGKWASGLLEFDSTPLDQAVAEANRYSTHRLVLADPGLAQLKVTGVFRAGDQRALALGLASAFALEARPSRGGDWILARPRSTTASKKSGG